MGLVPERFLLTDDIAGEGLVIAVVVNIVVVLLEETSTGFLERFLPLCICLSQYLESGYASFEHLHFFPSVLLHLPGSGSTFRPKPISKHPHPAVKKRVIFRSQVLILSQIYKTRQPFCLKKKKKLLKVVM